MKKGQSQQLLSELFIGKSKHKHKIHYPLTVQFHIQLLSMMQKDLGKEYPCRRQDSLVQVLGEYISGSQTLIKQLLLDCLDVDDGRYKKLNSSKKLRLLNFLCDEDLGITNMEKEMKKKLQDEIAKAIIMKNGAILSISENEALISRIKSEVAQTLASTLEVSETMDEEVMLKEDCRLDAVRSEPIFQDDRNKFHKFWRLSSYSGEADVLLQDIEVGDSVAAKERWYTYNTEQKAMVEKHISSFRMQRK